MPIVNNILGGCSWLNEHVHRATIKDIIRTICRIISRNTVKKIIIEGKTHSGRKFRPSDWAERMSGALSTFGSDNRIRYSPLLQPRTIDGIKCVVLDPKMQDQFPEMFRYIMKWADGNDLVVSEGDANSHGATPG